MSQLPFKPAWWLTNPHLQTLWPVFCRRRIKSLAPKRERVELTDGDFVDLDWVGEGAGPIVVILHGLEGSIQSSYVQGMLHAVVKQGWRGVCMHFRSCSGEPNRLSRVYHSGETGDIAEVVHHLKQREPETPLTAIGFSLGGNVLLKWLGETGQKNPLTAAIAVSVPFELTKAANKMNHGFSRLYQWRLLNSLCKKIKWKFQHQPAPFDMSILSTFNTLRDFDNHITAPLHGFLDEEDYYTQSSSRPYLQHIKIPTLLLQSKDDPLVGDNGLPEQNELSASVQLELSEKGGHVGFITGYSPLKPIYWLDQRAPLFFLPYLANSRIENQSNQYSR